MKKISIIFATLFLVFGIGNAQLNTLTPQEVQQGWKLLFNGQNLDGWITVRTQEPPTEGWTVEDGVLTVNKGGAKRGGDIITKDQYSDFDLTFEFRITKGANSGLKYFFTRYDKGGWLGFEYQILDDAVHPDAKLGHDNNRLQGGLYDMFAPAKDKKDSPVGEWNQGRVVSKGLTVEHYLNGQKVLTFERKSKAYMDAYELSKFKGSEPVFGDVKEGHILLQDHHDEVSFRNIKIKVLK
ncbi:MAG: DUF1080 domain-containing protein [Tannerella sp.]|nr:DUF1080 domain-containing protein [Tannerella sp.]